MTVPALHGILEALFVAGGGDPKDVRISLTTVERVVKECRAEAAKAEKNLV